MLFACTSVAGTSAQGDNGAEGEGGGWRKEKRQGEGLLLDTSVSTINLVSTIGQNEEHRIEHRVCVDDALFLGGPNLLLSYET